MPSDHSASSPSFQWRIPAHSSFTSSRAEHQNLKSSESGTIQLQLSCILKKPVTACVGPAPLPRSFSQQCWVCVHNPSATVWSLNFGISSRNAGNNPAAQWKTFFYTKNHTSWSERGLKARMKTWPSWTSRAEGKCLTLAEIIALCGVTMLWCPFLCPCCCPFSALKAPYKPLSFCQQFIGNCMSWSVSLTELIAITL